MTFARSLFLCLAFWVASTAQEAHGPVIVVDTVKGSFAFETFPADAPKTVAHIIGLVKRGFYDGQRIHRAAPGFLVEWGDPQSRDLAKASEWGRGPAASSGTPVGVAEMTKKRLHTKGAVAIAHPGSPRRPTVRFTSRLPRVLISTAAIPSSVTSSPATMSSSGCSAAT